MKQFTCGELVPGCQWRIEGDTEREILERVAVHAREAHGMDEVPAEVADTVRASIVER
jgi:predicted small metal-binding protein